MSLSAREQQALNAIEEHLADSDPKLASQLAMFTRLALAEAMPAREKIHAGRRAARRPAQRRHPRLSHARQLYQLMGWQRAMLLLWLLTAVVLTATALALSRGSGTWACTQPWPVGCASNKPTHRPHPAAHGNPPGHPLNWRKTAGVSQRQADAALTE